MGLLHKHDLPTLEEQHEQLHCIFMYKMIDGLVPLPADVFLTPQKQGCQTRCSRSTYFVSRNPVEDYTRKLLQ